MNLTQPPFDDIHVRKAMNWIIDKAALQKAWGGPIAGRDREPHRAADAMFNNELAEYDPYATPGDHGSVAKAKAEMKGSKYDPGKTASARASACKNVLMIADTRGVDTKHGPGHRGGRREDRHHLHGALDQRCVPDDPDPVEEHPDRRAARAGARTTPTRSRSSHRCSTASTIIPTGNTNYSLVGITPAIAKTVGATGNLHERPERRHATSTACSRASSAQDRTDCWENLDKKLMTKVVPWVPYLWSNNVLITARTSRTGSTTSSRTAPRTRTWRSSSNENRNEGRRTRAPPPPPPPTHMVFYIARRLVWTLVVVLVRAR